MIFLGGINKVANGARRKLIYDDIFVSLYFHDFGFYKQISNT